MNPVAGFESCDQLRKELKARFGRDIIVDSLEPTQDAFGWKLASRPRLLFSVSTCGGELPPRMFDFQVSIMGEVIASVRRSKRLVFSMNDNPYRSTTSLLRANPGVVQPRWYGFGLSVSSAVVGLMFGWQTLVIYAFSTMVDPQIHDSERSRIIAERFLFGDGRFQLVVVCVFTYLATTGLISAIVFFAVAVFHRPRLKVAAKISCSAGALATLSIVGYYLTRCM